MTAVARPDVIEQIGQTPLIELGSFLPRMSSFTLNYSGVFKT
jgi:hypothetical protein